MKPPSFLKAEGWEESPKRIDPPSLTFDEYLAFIGRLPTNVQSCSFNATTGDFSVTLAPTAPVEPKRKKDEDPPKVRDTHMIGRTAPIFGVEE